MIYYCYIEVTLNNITSCNCFVFDVVVTACRRYIMCINVSVFAGVFENAPLGNVFAEDADDWDVNNKTFTFVDHDDQLFFRFQR